MAKKKSKKKSRKKSFKLNVYQIIGIAFTLIIFLLVTFMLLAPAPEPTLSQDQVLALETSYWEEIVKDNPTYYQGYLELAKIQLESGNIDAAKEYYVEAKDINPNSRDVLEFEEFLED